jgi:hypothetical protein
MAISYITSLRSTRLSAVVTEIGSFGTLKIYTGTSPGVNSAASGTLLAVLTLAETACGTVTAGELNFSAITAEDSALADGTAGYARITKSNDAAVADLSIGATGSGADIILNNVNIVTGGEVSISSAKITEGNA